MDIRPPLPHHVVEFGLIRVSSDHVSAAVSGHTHCGGSNCPIIAQDGNKALDELPAAQSLSADNSPPLRMSGGKSVYMTT